MQKRKANQPRAHAIPGRRQQYILKKRRQQKLKRNIILALACFVLVLACTLFIVYLQIPDEDDLMLLIRTQNKDSAVQNLSVCMEISPQQEVYYEGDVLNISMLARYTNEHGEEKTYESNQNMRISISQGQAFAQATDTQVILHGSNETDQTVKINVTYFKKRYSYSITLIGVPHASAAKNTSSSSVYLLVNDTHTLDSQYQPDNLKSMENVDCVYGPNGATSQLRSDAAQAYTAMYNAAKQDGITLFLKDGYMDYTLCEEEYNTQNAKKENERTVINVCKPGANEHQTGLAVDITCSEINYQISQDFQYTEEYAWLLENAPLYGFVLRYPAYGEESTNRRFDPCHFRYIGEDAAQITKAKITLEEYFMQ